MKSLLTWLREEIALLIAKKALELALEAWNTYTTFPEAYIWAIADLNMQVVDFLAELAIAVHGKQDK